MTVRTPLYRSSFRAYFTFRPIPRNPGAARRRRGIGPALQHQLGATPGRCPIYLSPRWTIVVLETVPSVVLGVFLDSELLYMIDEPAGEVE
jgi:hypothetical protein